MTFPEITSVYAALAALLYFVLSVNAARLRRTLRIPIGDGGNEVMLRAMRIHANFNEYTPIVLLMLLMAELLGAAAALLHGGGICLLAGRGLHAWGVGKKRENYRFRTLGMALTFTALVGAACVLLGTVLLR